MGITLVVNAAVADDVYATLTTFPLEPYVFYRADFFAHQIVVPFIRFGNETVFTAQSSKTGAEHPGVLTYVGLVYSIGLELCLGFFEPATAQVMDANIGINNTYLVAEYFGSIQMGLAKQPNLDRTEYRFGLRFEF